MSKANGNYFVIYDWMVKDLKLKGNDLIVFAIIYGFNKSTKKPFKGSLKYLAEHTNCSIKGVLLNLQSLVNKGLLDKKDVYEYGVKHCTYSSKIIKNENHGGLKYAEL